MKVNSNIVSLDETLRGTSPSPLNSTSPHSKAAHFPGLISAIQVLITQLFGQHIQKFFDNIDDVLFQAAEKPTNFTEQNAYLDAMRELRLKRKQVEQNFVDRMFNALAYKQDDASGAVVFDVLQNVKAEQDEKMAAIDSESLSMLDDSRMEEMLAIDAMAKKLEAAHSEILLLLDARFAHIAGIEPSSRGEKTWVNPVSTKIICCHFAESCELLILDIKARVIVYKWFEKTISSCLGVLYSRINRQMIDANVLPDLTSDTLHKSYAETPASADAMAGKDAIKSAINPKALPINLFDEQRHQLVDFANANSTMALLNASHTPHYAPGLAGQIALIPASQQPAVSQSVLHGLWHGLQMHSATQANATAIADSAAMPVVASPECIVREFLSALGRSQSQPSIANQDRDIIGLVSVLFKFIIDDRVVAEPMKAAISRLQIPIIKAALSDASFFNESTHPARKLLNTMTEATVGWIPDKNWQTDGLYLAICSAVDFVIAEYNDDLQVFIAAEETLKIYLQSETRRTDIRQKRVVEVEQGRDQTAVVKNHIKTLLDDLLSEKAPQFIREILLGPWSQWLFIIYHREGEESTSWQQAIDTVRELLWTVASQRCAANRHDILALLPDLIKELRKGLDAVGYDRQMVAQFFARLEKLHLQVMERISPIETSAVKTAAANKKRSDVSHQAVQEQPNQKNRNSKVASVFVEQADALAVGQWIELHDGSGEKVRCRMVAILRNSGHRIFVNRSGCKAAELSVESIAEKLQSKQIRLIEDTHLFDRALSSVINNLRTRTKAVNI